VIERSIPIQVAGVRLWKAKGGDIETLQNILGHAGSSATTVDLYGTQAVQDMKESYARIMEDVG
jgi:hypothetical protein